MGQIPLINDAGLVLRESNAIIIYLTSKYRENRMYGSDVEPQATINQWLFWESSQWQPALAKVMGAHVGHKLLPSVLAAPESPPDWNAANCVKQLSFLENNLKNEWLAGSDISLADFSVAAMTTYFKVSGFPFDSYPNILRWYRQFNSRESWLQSEDPLWSNP